MQFYIKKSNATTFCRFTTSNTEVVSVEDQRDWSKQLSNRHFTRKFWSTLKFTLV